MAFKLPPPSAPALENPEALFRDIKTKKVKGPLADQADLWRDYVDKAIDLPDVALQLPTGAGKTLVGLMLAEWRRQRFGDRVVYLCPTRQLVNQVVDQAVNQYGLKVHGFTGAKKAYAKDAVAEYQNCERVAVTTYSSLFNAVPFFVDPRIIVLDDAHAAEQYISEMWSLSIHRNVDEHRALYEATISALKPAITGADFERLAEPEQTFRDRFWVEKLPTPTLWQITNELTKIIDANVSATEHVWVWRGIRDHLDACHLYLGAGTILIRPFLPPTLAHKPFVQAKQRIYMSATFGEAGELERITGRPKIVPLNAKASWERQTIGRRYFLFPERSLLDDEQLQLCAKLIARAGRALVLTPDDKRARAFKEFLDKNVHVPVFSAQDIEKSKATFVASPHAVAIVANRYDGIDFPEDQCRLLIIEGLPRATNLQEQFLISRMGAADLLNVRINTRLVQAFGRCTRSDQDYSAVVVRGEELNKHLMTPERRGFLHPELHAELLFGIEQAKGASISAYLENMDIFLAQGDDWRAANADIVTKRDKLEREQAPGADQLSAAAPIEIEFQLALWNKDFGLALDLARQILALLTHPRLRGYRALWHYFAGSAAWMGHKSGIARFDSVAREQFGAALKAERGISWLVPLVRYSDEADAAASAVLQDKETWSIVERIESLFDRLGTLNDHKYNKFEAEVRKRLENNEAKAFEEGHRQLGELLGYEAGNRNDTAAPDPWWLANPSLCFIFEDHSAAKPETVLSVEKARQACTHPNWVRANLKLDKDGAVVTVLVTPTKKAEPAALPHLADVFVWGLDDFRAWARNALSVIRELRREYPSSGDLVWRATAAERLAKACIAPQQLKQMLSERVGSKILGA